MKYTVEGQGIVEPTVRLSIMKQNDGYVLAGTREDKVSDCQWTICHVDSDGFVFINTNGVQALGLKPLKTGSQ